ncbi:MAG: DUF4040 domain-containing protein [Alphaproteobacteria bacterium]
MIFVVPDTLLLALVLATAFAIVRLRNLVAVVMLLGLYSLLMALVWVVLDAVDVAFTEAAVGAGITTILMLAAIALTGREEKYRPGISWPALVVVVATGAALVYATGDMPLMGAPDAPIHHHVAPRYIVDMRDEIDVPNMVTAVLASYRGYDTLGETTVIFTAGTAVFLLLGRGRRRQEDDDDDQRGDQAEDRS